MLWSEKSTQRSILTHNEFLSQTTAQRNCGMKMQMEYSFRGRIVQERNHGCWSGTINREYIARIRALIDMALTVTVS